MSNCQEKIRELDPEANLINFQAKDLLSLIDWENSKLSDPPLMKKIPTETLMRYIDSEDPPKLIYTFPCHTQGTERFIPLVANSSDKVSEGELDGFILAKLASRNLNSSVVTKAGYKINIT